MPRNTCTPRFHVSACGIRYNCVERPELLALGWLHLCEFLVPTNTQGQRDTERDSHTSLCTYTYTASYICIYIYIYTWDSAILLVMILRSWPRHTSGTLTASPMLPAPSGLVSAEFQPICKEVWSAFATGSLVLKPCAAAWLKPHTG